MVNAFFSFFPFRIKRTSRILHAALCKSAKICNFFWATLRSFFCERTAKARSNEIAVIITQNILHLICDNFINPWLKGSALIPLLPFSVYMGSDYLLNIFKIKPGKRVKKPLTSPLPYLKINFGRLVFIRQVSYFFLCLGLFFFCALLLALVFLLGH